MPSLEGAGILPEILGVDLELTSCRLSTARASAMPGGLCPASEAPDIGPRPISMGPYLLMLAHGTDQARGWPRSLQVG